MFSLFENFDFMIVDKIVEHMFISSLALALGIIVAIPIAILLANKIKLVQVVISICTVLQTIPSLALLAIMVPLFGIGIVPAVIALFIYSLLPILRNTVLGMQSVDTSLLDAAKGMGMSENQIIIKVQIPLALPVIMSGIRLSAVYVIGWTTLASFIGAGGIGDLIFSGLANFDIPLIVIGTLSVTTIALLIDLILGRFEKILAPKTSSKKIRGTNNV